MLLFDKRDHFHTAGDFYRVDGQPGNRGAWQRDEGQFDTETHVFSACGGSSAYRRAMLDQVGLLDDDFFFSLEDMDLAWRGQKKKSSSEKDRKSTRLNSSHQIISYAVFSLKKKT